MRKDRIHIDTICFIYLGIIITAAIKNQLEEKNKPKLGWKPFQQRVSRQRIEPHTKRHQQYIRSRLIRVYSHCIMSLEVSFRAFSCVFSPFSMTALFIPSGKFNMTCVKEKLCTINMK